ncbi:MAG: hypothetical protein HC836_39460 [Richelia sp. RM2_1_2]|nr:hypothetical protein [Richelia sp. RM2_1_2]
MEIKLDYSIDQIKEFLHKRGYSITPIVVDVAVPIYHNRIDHEKMRFLVLYKDNERYPKEDHNFHHAEQSEDFVRTKFQELFRNELMDILNGEHFLNK